MNIILYSIVNVVTTTQYCYVYKLNVFYSCIPSHRLELLHPIIVDFSEYSLSWNHMIYMYTSERNLTKKWKDLEIVVEILNLYHYLPTISFQECTYYLAIVIYNTAFVPCNMTTGMPRPLCSSACYYFRHSCDHEYKDFIAYANLFGIPITDDYCENTFEPINKVFHFPNSSKDFESDCLDFPGNV